MRGYIWRCWVCGAIAKRPWPTFAEAEEAAKNHNRGKKDMAHIKTGYKHSISFQ